MTVPERLGSLLLLLTLSAAAEATEAPTYRILGASIWTGSVFEPRDLVVRDGGLVDPEPGVEIPSLDWSGYYLIPGLIDAHTHLFEWGLPLPEEAEGDLDSEAIRTGSQALLLSGVTSARTHLPDGPRILASRHRESLFPDQVCSRPARSSTGARSGARNHCPTCGRNSAGSRRVVRNGLRSTM